MATVSKEGNLIKVRMDRSDFLKGLLPDFSQNFAFREGDGLSVSAGVNPWRSIGYLEPGFNATDVTNMASITDNAIIRNIATPNTGEFAYGIENSTKLHQLTSNTGAVNATPHTITAHGGHTGVEGSDVVAYSIGGTEYIFYSWNDDTDGDVGRYNLGTWTTAGNFDDDYMSTVPTGAAALTSGVPHPMIVGSDDILYIGNGSEIVAYDGPNDTAATLAFKVPDGYTITSFSKTANHLVVFCSTRTSYTAEQGQSYAFFWDYASEDADYKYDLNCNYVNGAFSYKGTVGVFGVRPSFASNRSFIMLYNGSQFETVASFPQKIPGHGGVDIIDNQIVFNAGGVSGTNRIYTYGALLKGFDNALNCIEICGGATAEGVLASTIYSIHLASSGANGELQSFSTDYAANATAYSGLKDIDFGRYGQGKVVDVKVVYKSKVTDGRAFTLTLNTDSSGTITDARGTTTTLLSSATSLDTLIKHYEFASDGTELPQFSNSVGIGFAWGSGTASEAHSIQSVEIFIEPVSTES
jgi:hypothetical protein